MSRRRTGTLLPIQAGLAMICFAVLAVWPPVAGRMMLVPLSASASGSAARTAIAAGALLLDAGPLPGSLVVIGERARLLPAARSGAMIVLAAPPAGCRGGDRGAA